MAKIDVLHVNFSCMFYLYVCSICIMAFGVADDDGDITTNGIVTGSVTLFMSVVHLACAFKVSDFPDVGMHG